MKKIEEFPNYFIFRNGDLAKKVNAKSGKYAFLKEKNGKRHVRSISKILAETYGFVAAAKYKEKLKNNER